MKNKTFFKDGVKGFDKLSCEELLYKLRHEQDSGKKVPFIITLSAKHKAATNLISILLNEVANDSNQKTKALWGISVAMVAAMALIDIGTLSDKFRLKQEIDKWSDDNQKQDFKNYLASEGITL